MELGHIVFNKYVNNKNEQLNNIQNGNYRASLVFKSFRHQKNSDSLLKNDMYV